eukprot:g49619.t1
MQILTEIKVLEGAQDDAVEALQNTCDAVEALQNKLEINGTTLKIAWGKKKVKKAKAPPPGMGGAPAPLLQSVRAGTAPPPPANTGPGPVLYPSQDPHQLATKLANA